jgi:hypothetical protein
LPPPAIEAAPDARHIASRTVEPEKPEGRPMTNEERDMISQFVARVSGAQASAPPSGPFGGSVPATTQPAQPPLPPVDPDADQHIRGLYQRMPEAPYRMTQLAFVQEHALTEAQNRIQRLEWELQQAQQAAQAAQQQQVQQRQAPPSSGGGFFGGLFGGRPQPSPQPGAGPAWNQGGAAPQPQPQWQQAAPPPQPQYPPNYQPGVFQSSGGTGFFGSALRTAAGVAGGVVAADALMGLFSGNRGYGGGSPMFGGGAAPFAGSPWGGGAPAEPGYVDQGTWDQGSGGMPAADQNFVDNGSWDQPTDPSAAPDASWNDGGGGGTDDGSGGGWDSGGGDTGGGDTGGGDTGGGSDSLC